jgi:hypothetical protein
MKKKLSLMLVVSAVMLSSCSDSFDIPEVATTTSKLQINAAIDGMTLSRAADNQWDDGDAISVYADSLMTNTKFITTGDGIFLPEDGDVYFNDSETHHITACYPYKSGTDDSYTFTINFQNANPTGQKKCDILFAEGDASITNPCLNLVFKHKMARLIFNVKTSTEHGFKKEDIFASAEGSTIIKSQGQLPGLALVASVKPKTGEVSPYALRLSPKLSNGIDDYDTGVRQYVLLVPEQQAVQYRHLFNEGSSNALTFTASLGDKVWKAGYSYTYNITIKNTGMSVTNESVEEWTDGGTEDFDAI